MSKPSEIIKLKIPFKDYLHAIARCYADKVQKYLPETSDFPDSIFTNDCNILISKLTEFSKSVDNNYLTSVTDRMIGLWLIQDSRDKTSPLNIAETWNYISKSILNIDDEATISSIGSQGFLSIPLFKFDKKMSSFEFIRLHIWHDELLKHIDSNKSDKFSIHSHSFHAQSWIINGKIINKRFTVELKDDNQDFSLFEIKYNETLNKVNQHTSIAVNTNKKAFVQVSAQEEFNMGNSYEIKTGEYHSSSSAGKNGLASTFFSFTATDKIIPKSYVVGPSTIESSKINRKVHINPKEFIKLIDDNINQ